MSGASVPKAQERLFIKNGRKHLSTALLDQRGRLSPELLGTVLKVAPFLSESGGGDLAGVASGLLGGFLK